MKNLNLKITALSVMIICIMSCITEESVSFPDPGIDRQHLEVMTRMGFDISTIVELDDYYLVEGDIALYKTDISQYLDIADIATRQYRTINLVSAANVKNIAIASTWMGTGAGPLNIEWVNALKEAVSHWNSIPGCNIYMSYVGTLGGDIY